MAIPTRGTALANAGNSSAPTVTSVVVPSGSGRELIIRLTFRRSTTESVTTAPTRDSQVGTLIGSRDSATNFAVRWYQITNANAGTADVVAALSASRNWQMVCVPYTDVDTVGTVVLEDDLSVDVSATADDEILSMPAVYFSTANAQSFTPTSPVSELASTDTRGNDIYGAAGERTGTGTVTSAWTFSATATASIGSAVAITGTASGASAALTGTLLTAPIYRSDIVAGGKTIIATLTGDTWVAAGATFDAIRDDIIAGLDAASSPTNGWNDVVRDTMAVTSVVRTSDTVVTITLPAFATYASASSETVMFTIPAAALTGAVGVVATPTIPILVGPLVDPTSDTTDGSGVTTADVETDDPTTANGEVILTTCTDTLTGLVLRYTGKAT